MPSGARDPSWSGGRDPLGMAPCHARKHHHSVADLGHTGGCGIFSIPD